MTEFEQFELTPQVENKKVCVVFSLHAVSLKFFFSFGLAFDFNKKFLPFLSYLDNKTKNPEDDAL